MENTNAHTDFLGRGWAWPPAFDRTSVGAEMVAGPEDVRQSIEILLATRRGERVMNRLFGAGMDGFIFESLNSGNVESVAATLRDGLARWEPRIRVEQLSIVQQDLTLGRIDLLIDYTIRATNSRYNMVFPYYLETGADPEQ